MKIALDYDLTYSADPSFFRAFVLLAEINGHDVRIVTARDERFDRTAPLAQLEEIMPVIYCRGIAKRFYCSHFTDFQPDIWIDDKPESIGGNSTASPESLVQWRAEREDGAQV